MLRGKLENILTDDIIDVYATTESPDSSYGLLCWMDAEGNSYGQIQFGAPLGFVLLGTWEDPDDDH